jgi:hypothetical protein
MSVMRIRTAARRALRLSLAFALAMPLVTLEILAAEAGPSKVRDRASASPTTVDRAGEHLNTRARLPIRIRIRSGSGSGSDSAERQDEKARPKSPDAAAAAAARARAALAAEKAAQGRRAATAGGENQPIPLGKTTNYSNGVTCLAGC